MVGQCTVCTIVWVELIDPRDGSDGGVDIIALYDNIIFVIQCNDEVLSSTSEIILTNETDISDLIDYMSTISELNIGEEEYRRRIEDLKLRLREYENISNEVQDLQISIQDLVAQNQELHQEIEARDRRLHQEIEARDRRLQFLLYLVIIFNFLLFFFK